MKKSISKFAVLLFAAAFAQQKPQTETIEAKIIHTENGEVLFTPLNEPLKGQRVKLEKAVKLPHKPTPQNPVFCTLRVYRCATKTTATVIDKLP